jgi:hypothetical protein
MMPAGWPVVDAFNSEEESMNPFIKAVRITLLAAFAAAPCAQAASGVVVGSAVEYVRSHDGTAFPAWAPPGYWFTLKGVTSAGTCAKWTSGTVMFVGTDKQTLSLVLMAMSTGQGVEVQFDDTNLINGFCRAGFVTIGNPPPSS